MVPDVHRFLLRSTQEWELRCAADRPTRASARRARRSSLTSPTPVRALRTASHPATVAHRTAVRLLHLFEQQGPRCATRRAPRARRRGLVVGGESDKRSPAGFTRPAGHRRRGAAPSRAPSCRGEPRGRAVRRAAWSRVPSRAPSHAPSRAPSCAPRVGDPGVRCCAEPCAEPRGTSCVGPGRAARRAMCRATRRAVRQAPAPGRDRESNVRVGGEPAIWVVRCELCARLPRLTRGLALLRTRPRGRRRTASADECCMGGWRGDI
eukprot:1488927-Prymnesium_polylepis.1